MGKPIRIGAFSAFWGDTPTAAAQLVRQGGGIDYLIGDYLAEVTLCILARVKAKKAKGGAGDGGYVADFVRHVWKPLMHEIMDQNIKVVTNAGGMNPSALKAAIEQVARDAGAPVPVVAVVLGDDLAPQYKKLGPELQPFAVEGDVESLPRGKLMSCNAYLGAVPVAEALRQGAQIVITGRGVDSALVLGPLMHEHGWTREQFDLLSAGSLAGHLIECGAQCTGGNFTDWQDVAATYDNMGFPIAEVDADGSFIITKPQGTGGMVTVGTVAEQLVYEIHDPGNYYLPDVVCDWTQVTMQELPAPAGQQRSDRVRVQGARGRAPSDFYKVGSAHQQGFRASGSLLITGFDARLKAEAVAAALLTKTQRLLKLYGLGAFTQTRVECVGAETTYGDLASAAARNTREISLRITVAHPNPKALGVFALELAPSATSMVPGITGGTGSRPKASPFLQYSSSLIHKRLVPARVVVGEANTVTNMQPWFSPSAAPALPSLQPWHAPVEAPPLSIQRPPRMAQQGGAELVTVPLIALCFGRSGDKGDVCNIGLIAREARFYPLLQREVTAEAVKNYLGHLLMGKVARYELPGTHALNYVCTKALGGGGTASLHIDTQGKTYAQKLLGLPVQVPKGWLGGDDKWLRWQANHEALSSGLPRSRL